MGRPHRVLVIDDEEVMRDSCSQVLSKVGHEVATAGNGEEGLSRIHAESFDLVLLDLRMPGIDGMEVLKKLQELNPETAVVVITGHATVESAVEAMKLGAYDFLPKPFTPDTLRAVAARALEQRELRLENVLLREEIEASVGADPILGESVPMQEIKDLIRKVAPTDSTVLITGESGTGKELVARSIHRHSIRRNKPFIVVDCGALVESLFESELFGHVKGAFTGAVVSRPGRLELANNGTVFLDEIGNISLSIQTKILRAIQEREVTRVGGTQVMKIDVRIIAATNKDLYRAVVEGGFREDLFYRLSVVPIVLPPLRQRKEDIPLLAEYFLKKYSRKRKKNVFSLSPDAIQIMQTYDWPGNVRELENTIERAVVLAESEVIRENDLLFQGLSAPALPKPSSAPQSHLEHVEREHIIKTLKLLGGNKTKVAKSLGIDRKTLRRKMVKYAIKDQF